MLIKYCALFPELSSIDWIRQSDFLLKSGRDNEVKHVRLEGLGQDMMGVVLTREHLSRPNPFSSFFMYICVHGETCY